MQEAMHKTRFSSSTSENHWQFEGRSWAHM